MIPQPGLTSPFPPMGHVFRLGLWCLALPELQLQLHDSHACTPSTQTCQTACRPDLRLALLPWACLLITGLCPSLIADTRPDSNLHPRLDLRPIAIVLSGDPDTLLSPAAISRPALLASLGSCGMGPRPVRSLLCQPCKGTRLRVP